MIMENSSRARGALYGLAIGDALGMPTQLLSRRQIRERWGPLLRGFEPAPPGHPIAAGLPAGAVTGDTNGAAMRIAPVGIAVPVSAPGDLATLVDHVVAASRVTRNTSIALAGAAAVSAGISGASLNAQGLELAALADALYALRTRFATPPEDSRRSVQDSRRSVQDSR